MLAQPILRSGLFAVFILAAASASAQTRAETPPPAMITLPGSAEIAVRPDRAEITTGVVSEAETAREALDLNSAALARVIAALKEAGIEERDIATTGFSVEPRYHYPDSRGGEPPRIVGYQVTNQLRVLVRDLDMLGGVLDRAVTVGANRIHSIHFVVSDADRRLDEARAEAFRDARRKAELYAEAAGFRLLRILSVSEARPGHEPPRPLMARSLQFDSAESVPIEAGEQTLKVHVDISWEIGE